MVSDKFLSQFLSLNAQEHSKEKQELSQEEVELYQDCIDKLLNKSFKSTKTPIEATKREKLIKDTTEAHKWVKKQLKDKNTPNNKREILEFLNAALQKTLNDLKKEV